MKKFKYSLTPAQPGLFYTIRDDGKDALIRIEPNGVYTLIAFSRDAFTSIDRTLASLLRKQAHA